MIYTRWFLISTCFTSTILSFSVLPTGIPSSVWGSTDALHKCGVNDVPDIPARVFVDTTGLTHMIIGSTAFHWMTGPSIFNQTRNCTPAWNSTQDPDPSMFSSAEWLDSPHVFVNGTVISLVHVEYDAMNIEVPKCPHNYPLCWTVTVTLARSDDFGYTWRHAQDPPNNLVASVPYKFNQSQPASGWGDPSNLVKSPSDGYYYFGVLNRNQVGLQSPGICFARSVDLLDPRSWRAYGGSTIGWNVSWVSPYTMEPGTEADHICTVASNLPACMPSGLVWSTYLSLYVITMDCINNQGGLFISTSPDLINWTTADEFYKIKDLPTAVAKNVTSMTYPTFIDPSSIDGGNFGAIGQNASLFWVSIGHSPYTDGRRLWSTPFTFYV
jgi:hypothetical protein